MPRCLMAYFSNSDRVLIVLNLKYENQISDQKVAYQNYRQAVRLGDRWINDGGADAPLPFW
jgi:hypothetical protein